MPDAITRYAFVDVGRQEADEAARTLVTEIERLRLYQRLHVEAVENTLQLFGQVDPANLRDSMRASGWDELRVTHGRSFNVAAFGTVVECSRCKRSFALDEPISREETQLQAALIQGAEAWMEDGLLLLTPCPCCKDEATPNDWGLGCSNLALDFVNEDCVWSDHIRYPARYESATSYRRTVGLKSDLPARLAHRVASMVIFSPGIA